MHRIATHPEQGSAPRPRVLLTDTNRWPVVPRLALRLARLGCEVAVLCPVPGHPVESLSPAPRVFPYSGRQPLRSLRRAIESLNPDVVIPACDRGVQHLHQLYEVCHTAGGNDFYITRLIENSLGSPDSYSVVSSRNALLQLALHQDILVPNLCPVSGIDDLRRWAAEVPFPWVVKADGTWGGRGVRVANSLAEAEQHFRELTEHAGTMELLKRLCLNRDRGWVFTDWNRPRPAVVAQSFIPGRPANCAAFCCDGEVHACIAVEVIQSDGPTGPASIVQVVDSPAMLRAAQLIAQSLRLSGIFGLDFVIDDTTGKHYLIEMNPRCTPPCPLPLGEQRDLVQALWFQLTGEEPQSSRRVSSARIAYFPQVPLGPENAADALLGSCYHDLPLDEPALVRALLHPWRQRSVAGQIVDMLRRIVHRTHSPHAVRFEGAMANRTAALVDLPPSADQLSTALRG